MLENDLNRCQPDHPYDPEQPYYPGDPPQLRRWMQHKLYKQGINPSPEEAQKLFELQIVHDAKRWLQRDLAEQGMDVSPDEAVAIHGLHTMYLMMEYTGIADPQEAIERMASDDSCKPYNL